MQSNSTDLFGEPVNPATRFCTKCRTNKPLAGFRKGKNRGRVRRWNHCVECMNAKMRDYLKTSKGRAASKRSKCKMYGITVHDYNRMFAEQGGACAICGETDLPIDPRTDRPYQLAIDHCHATGKVRSLLCHHCNVGLGGFKDRTDVLHAAISYLKKHQVC